MCVSICVLCVCVFYLLVFLCVSRCVSVYVWCVHLHVNMCVHASVCVGTCVCASVFGWVCMLCVCTCVRVW